MNCTLDRVRPQSACEVGPPMLVCNAAAGLCAERGRTAGLAGWRTVLRATAGSPAGHGTLAARPARGTMADFVMNE
eukprot:4232772-Prymnesium_polylepis.1